MGQRNFGGKFQGEIVGHNDQKMGDIRKRRGYLFLRSTCNRPVSMT